MNFSCLLGISHVYLSSTNDLPPYGIFVGFYGASSANEERDRINEGILTLTSTISELTFITDRKDWVIGKNGKIDPDSIVFHLFEFEEFDIYKRWFKKGLEDYMKLVNDFNQELFENADYEKIKCEYHNEKENQYYTLESKKGYKLKFEISVMPGGRVVFHYAGARCFHSGRDLLVREKLGKEYRENFLSLINKISEYSRLSEGVLTLTSSKPELTFITNPNDWVIDENGKVDPDSIFFHLF